MAFKSSKTRIFCITMAAAMFMPVQPSAAQFFEPTPVTKVTASYNRIDIEYYPPGNAQDKPLFDALRRQQVLEKLQLFFSPLRAWLADFCCA